ncbi:MAG: hypothetical protein GX357_08190 [Firmicutes bacterium]|nr:hypothetical protein [Bacillota bacterium]
MKLSFRGVGMMPLLSKVIKAEKIFQAGSRQVLLQPPAAPAPPKPQKGEKEAAQVQTQADKAEKLLAEAEIKLQQAEAKAAEILAAAQTEKEQILQQAQEEAERLRQEARQEGYDKGLKTGLEQGAEKSQELIKEAEKQLEETRQLRKEMLQRVEPQVVELAVKIAEKFVGQKLVEDAQILQQLIEEALRQIQETGEIIIRLHPEDAAACREKLPLWQEELGEYATLNLLSDHTLQRGDCRVESTGSVYSCQVDERFASLRKMLTEVVTHA